jgi:hypothetical protein
MEEIKEMLVQLSERVRKLEDIEQKNAITPENIKRWADDFKKADSESIPDSSLSESSPCT